MQNEIQIMMTSPSLPLLNICCPLVSPTGGVLPSVSGEDLQDPEGAGGEEADPATEAGPGSGASWHGPAPHRNGSQ